jgi:phytoene/squalene synthetase
VTAEACADLVERGDPDRWRTVMAAPPDRRAGLLALYAFNLEIARAPYVASESMLAEIRLRWWTDAVAEIFAGAPPRRHEVVAPLADAVAGGELPQELFDGMIAARLFDAGDAPFDDLEALRAYVDATSGNLMDLTARHLGASGVALPVVRRFARGAGVAALLRALPDLEALGRAPLPPGADVAEIARHGLADIQAARADRAVVPPAAAAALLPGWLADIRLHRAVADPECVLKGGLEVSEFRSRAVLLRRVATGRW